MPLELFTMVGGALSGFIFKFMANSQQDRQQRELINSKNFARHEESLNNARKLNTKHSNWVRRFIVIMFFTIATFIIIAGVFVPTNLVIDIPGSSFLGIFSWSASTKVITVEGLVAYPWISHGIMGILSFYFGQGPAKRI